MHKVTIFETLQVWVFWSDTFFSILNT